MWPELLVELGVLLGVWTRVYGVYSGGCCVIEECDIVLLRVVGFARK